VTWFFVAGARPTSETAAWVRSPLSSETISPTPTPNAYAETVVLTLPPVSTARA